MAAVKGKNDQHKDLARFYNKKLKEPTGGKFFTIYHRKAPAEYGVWARSVEELKSYLNKIRKHFASIEEEITA